jgi:rhamnosyltransferase
MTSGNITPMPPEPVAETVCAVVITWFPDRGVVQRIARILEQAGSMVIIDNGSSEEIIALLRGIASSPSVDLLENNENKGVARALNQAAEIAAQSGAQWMLTFDQDTVVRDALLESLIAVFRVGSRKAAIIGSNYWSTAKQRRFLGCGRHRGKKYVERKTVITSGTLVWLGLLGQIGGFREDYFIDSVDHEYCLRARAHGYRVLISCAELMSHSIGDDSGPRRRFIAYEHPAIRKYYMTRNTLVTLSTYFSTEPLWAFCQIIRLVAELVSIIFLESDKRCKARYYFRGVRDALAGRMGRVSGGMG